MMNITLLAAQAALADTLAGGNPVLTPVSEEARMNLWDMAMKGGWIMLVLALLSVVCFYIFFERMAVIRKAGKDDPLFMERSRDYIRTGEIKSAINYCRITNTPSARMIEKGITRMGRPVADVQAAIENSGNIEGSFGTICPYPPPCGPGDSVLPGQRAAVPESAKAVCAGGGQPALSV